MTAQELLQNSLNNLSIVEKSSFSLDFDQAMDLIGAINRISGLLSELKKEEKDWDAESFSHFLDTKNERMARMKEKLAELEEYSNEACRQ
jgi:hypothetical protein